MTKGFFLGCRSIRFCRYRGSLRSCFWRSLRLSLLFCFRLSIEACTTGFLCSSIGLCPTGAGAFLGLRSLCPGVAECIICRATGIAILGILHGIAASSIAAGGIISRSLAAGGIAILGIAPRRVSPASCRLPLGIGSISGCSGIACIEAAVSGNCQQRLLQIPRTYVPVTGLIRRCFQHNLLQFLRTVLGSRKRLATVTPFTGFCLLHGGRCLRRQGQEGFRSLIEHPIQHQAQRINIRRSAVFPMVIYLRCLETGSADRGTRRCKLRNLGNTKVTQFDGAILCHQNIIRFNIPMDNIVVFTGDQCITNLHTHIDHLLLGDVFAQIPVQRCQQFHSNADLPTKSIGIRIDLNIVALDNVGISPQPLHHLIFLDNLITLLFIALCNTGNAVVVALQHFNFRYIRRNANQLQCRFLLMGTKRSMYLIDLSISPSADPAHLFPAIPRIVCRHLFPPLIPPCTF